MYRRTLAVAIGLILALSVVTAAEDAQACVVDPDCAVNDIVGAMPECLEIPDRVFCMDPGLQNNCSESITLWPVGCEEPCADEIVAGPGQSLYLSHLVPFEASDYLGMGEDYTLDLGWHSSIDGSGEFSLSFFRDGHDDSNGCEEEEVDGPAPGDDNTPGDGDDDQSDDMGCTSVAGQPDPLLLFLGMVGLFGIGRRQLGRT